MQGAYSVPSVQESTIGDLMFDAMAEDTALPASSNTSDAPAHRTKANTTAVRTDDESILFADSEDDDDVVVGVASAAAQQQSTQVYSQVSSDDDFQIVTAPTSTGVVRVPEP